MPISKETKQSGSMLHRESIKAEPKKFNYETFKTNPAQFLETAIKDYVLTSPANWSVPFSHPFFIEPVVAFGNGDDQAFLDIKKKYPWTLLPRECLEQPPAVAVSTVTGAKKSVVDMPVNDYLPVISKEGIICWPKGYPPTPPWPVAANPPRARSGGIESGFGQTVTDVSVISIGLPIHPETLKQEASYPWGNSPELKINSILGGHEGFIRSLSIHIETILGLWNYSAVTPDFRPWGAEFTFDFGYEGKTSRDPISPAPQRNWAVACGLGTYGIHDMVITAKGTAVLLTTVITSAKISPSQKPSEEYCLWYRNRSCSACVGRCPGEAINIKGDPVGRLSARCHGGAIAAAVYNMTYLKDKMVTSLGQYTDRFCGVLRFPACGRCYTDIPCATSIPD